MPTKTRSASIIDSTESYESWLAEQTEVVADDLKGKHKKMEASPFVYLRGTFYRWAETFPERCPDAAGAPTVLAVGDLHVNNFGLWRDGEGRLAWGVNDFDEAHQLPYTNDLIRLGLSAGLVDEEADLDFCLEDACDAIVKGYRAGLRKGGRPFVLAERNDWIRDLALTRLVHPDRFWAKLDKLPAVAEDEVPADAREALEALLPEPGMPYRLVRRVAGVGSLGRPRFVAIAEWSGGRVAREAKAVVPSACVWSGGGGDGGPHYDHFFGNAKRSRDPWAALCGDWVVRRLAPDCTRIELDSLPDDEGQQVKLLKAMGQEAANVHLAKGDPDLILADLDSRQPDWLYKEAKRMNKALKRDWLDWCRR